MATAIEELAIKTAAKTSEAAKVPNECLMPPDFVPSRCSARTVCPVCRRKVTTVTKSKPGLFTYVMIGGLAVLGCGLGCCLLPLSVKCCKDVHHKCPVCKKFLGKYAKLRF